MWVLFPVIIKKLAILMTCLRCIEFLLLPKLLKKRIGHSVTLMVSVVERTKSNTLALGMFTSGWMQYDEAGDFFFFFGGGSPKCWKVGRTKILYLDREKSRVEASTKYIYNMTTFYYLNILFHFLFNKYLWRIEYISAIVLGSGNTYWKGSLILHEALHKGVSENSLQR